MFYLFVEYLSLHNSVNPKISFLPVFPFYPSCALILFQKNFECIFLNQKICVKSVRKQEFRMSVKENEYSVYPVFYPIGNGMRNIDLAIEDLNYILKN